MGNYLIKIGLDKSDLIILILGLLGSIYITINRPTSSKKNVSNFLLGYYFLVMLYLILSFDGKLILRFNLIPLLILVILHTSKSMSMSIFNNDEILQYLNSYEILNYYIKEVFYTSRLDIAYCYSLISLFLFPIKFKIVIFSVFFLIQFYLQIKNNFEVHPFKDVYYDRFNNNSVWTIDITQNEVELLSYVLYMEDRDFWYRNKFTYDIIAVVIRKYIISNYDYEFGIEYYILPKEKLKLVKHSKKIIIELFSMLCYYSRRLPSFFSQFSINGFFRGYGTIPQQLVRTKALKNFGTYDRNKYRRKLFIERAYTKYFYKSLLRIKINRLSLQNEYSHLSKNRIKELAQLDLKKEILFSYYKNILNEAENINQLIDNMIKIAKTGKSREILKFSWNNRYFYDVYHILNSELYWNLIDY